MIANNLTANSQLILIVDDDKSIRMTARLVLEVKGYQVIEAENGQQCLDIYRLLIINCLRLFANKMLWVIFVKYFLITILLN